MNILTIDLEDWFHILAHDATAQPVQWEKFESRVERNTAWLLEQFSVRKQKATFFCLGWVAEKYPALIAKIAAEGHEIGCHGMYHQLVYLQTPAAFRSDTMSCIKLLEDITGKKVTAYRAAGFSVGEKSKWFFESLAECGIETDCSVFPAGRNHGGYKNFPSSNPCLLSVSGQMLKEFPVSLFPVAGKKLAFSGGGYFRILPYFMIRYCMRRSAYVMTYFHPRDFDASQPLLTSLPFKRRLMSYTGLKKSRQKFIRLIDEFSFVTIGQASKEINWSDVPVVPVA